MSSASDKEHDMEDSKKAATMWTMGFGDSGQRFQGAEKIPEEQRTLRNDWKTYPMPRERAEIDCMLPLSTSEFNMLACGHRPQAMEDHWFMYFDGDAFCFHRSWTGYCIYQVHVRHADQCYELFRITANRDRTQYAHTSDEGDRIMATILICEALGRDATELWEQWFAMQPTHETCGRRIASEPIGFWKEDEPYGFCSNWYLTSPFELFGMHFATSEHWMMWQKARVMGDFQMADAILQAPTAWQAKELGTKVKPYDDTLWGEVREQLVAIGVREKFLQNPSIARELLKTGSVVLAEASPKDNVWGVGITAGDPGFADMTGWKGENLLGRTCMRVRSELMMLLDQGAGQIECGTTEDEIDGVMRSNVGSQSLIALTRNPVTRATAMTYARIARFHAKQVYPNLHAFLSKAGQKRLCDLEELLGPDHEADPAAIGLRELLVQLAFLRRLGSI